MNSAQARSFHQSIEPAAAASPEPRSGWPAPNMALVRPFSDQPAPAFPISALPTAMAGAAKGIADASGAPIDFTASALLALSAGLIGNARRVSPWSGWSEPCALNVALVGAPSSGKSPALDKPVSIIRDIEAAEAVAFASRMREHETQCAAAEEAHARWRADVKTAIQINNPAPTMPEQAVAPEALGQPCIIATDATTEALARLEADNPKGLILVRDELAGLLSGMGRYGNDADRQYFLEAFGGRPFRVDRVKRDRPIMIERHTLSIVGGIQPDRLSTLLLKGDDDGLAARFLFCWPAPARPQRPSTQLDLQPLRDAFERLRALDLQDGKPAIMQLDDNAANTFETARQRLYDHEQRTAGMLQSAVGKMPGVLLRLSGLLSLSGRVYASPEAPPMAISSEQIAGGELLVDYFLQHAERVYGEAGQSTAEKHAASLAREILRRENCHTINARTIRVDRWVPGLRKAADVDAALAILEAEDWIAPAFQRSGHSKGRARKDFQINPRTRLDRPISLDRSKG